MFDTSWYHPTEIQSLRPCSQLRGWTADLAAHRRPTRCRRRASVCWARTRHAAACGYRRVSACVSHRASGSCFRHAWECGFRHAVGCGCRFRCQTNPTATEVRSSECVQCVSVRFSTLHVSVRFSAFQYVSVTLHPVRCTLFQSVSLLCCRILQNVAKCCRMLRNAAECCSILHSRGLGEPNAQGVGMGWQGLAAWVRISSSARRCCGALACGSRPL